MAAKGGSPLTGKRLRAALLVAEDQLTDPQIAELVGVGLRTIERWKTKPEFQEAVTAHRTRWEHELATRGLANRFQRLYGYNDRHGRLRQLIEKRAADPRMEDFPGGQTGLLVAEPMLVKVYGAVDYEGDEDLGGDELKPFKESRIVYVAKVDAAVLRELRELEKQAAQDIGDWTDKRDVTVNVRELVEQVAGALGVDPTELAAEVEAVRKVAR